MTPGKHISRDSYEKRKKHQGVNRQGIWSSHLDHRVLFRVSWVHSWIAFPSGGQGRHWRVPEEQRR
jgi:hypothetical protein